MKKKGLLIAAAVIAVGLFSCNFDVMYADWKIDRLCAQDGGIKVYVRDEPPVEFLKSDGSLDLEKLARAKPTQSYHFERATVDIRTEDPTMYRSETRLVRQVDNAVLGTGIVYHRSGQYTSIPVLSRRPHRCPDINVLLDIPTAVFHSRMR